MVPATENLTAGAKRELLRHALATIAYRGGKAVRGASEGFRDFGANEFGKTPGQILAHMGDLLEWSLGLLQGKHAWHGSAPMPWPDEIHRFFAALEALDAYLASDGPVGCSLERLLQGPIADALTHVGQIAMLRRLAGEPMKGENYFVAEITTGRAGEDQAGPVREF